jgi:hypothetical protein
MNLVKEAISAAAIALAFIVPAKACVIDDWAAGWNGSNGAASGPWVRIYCSDGSWYGAWAVYSSAAHVQDLISKAIDAKVFGANVYPDGSVYSWNSTYFGP